MEEEVKNTVDNSVNNLEKISAFVINYLDELLTSMHLEVKNDVKKTKNAVELDNMNSYERRIIHNALKDEKEISTISVGEEPNRHIVIKFIENQED